MADRMTDEERKRRAREARRRLNPDLIDDAELTQEQLRQQLNQPSSTRTTVNPNSVDDILGAVEGNINKAADAPSPRRPGVTTTTLTPEEVVAHEKSLAKDLKAMEKAGGGSLASKAVKGVIGGAALAGAGKLAYDASQGGESAEDKGKPAPTATPSAAPQQSDAEYMKMLMTDTEAAPVSKRSQAAYAAWQRATSSMGELQPPEFVSSKEEYNKVMQGVESDFRKEIQEAVNIRNATNDKLERRELTEKLIGALGLLIAGLYGEKAGVNMGGTKVESSDWDKKYAAAREDLNTAMSVAKEKMSYKERDAARQASFSKEKNEAAQESFRNEMAKRRETVDTAKSQVELARTLDQLDLEAFKAKQDKADAFVRAKSAEDQKTIAAADKLQAEARNLVVKYYDNKTTDEEKPGLLQALGSINAQYRNITKRDLMKPESMKGKKGWFFDTAPKPEIDPTSASVGITSPMGPLNQAPAAPGLADDEMVVEKDGVRYVVKKANPSKAVRIYQ